MSQINKISEIQFLFQWYKMIIKIYFCCDQSIHNQMLHNAMEKNKNLIGTTKSDFFKSL